MWKYNTTRHCGCLLDIHSVTFGSDEASETVEAKASVGGCFVFKAKGCFNVTHYLADMLDCICEEMSHQRNWGLTSQRFGGASSACRHALLSIPFPVDPFWRGFAPNRTWLTQISEQAEWWVLSRGHPNGTSHSKSCKLYTSVR